MCVLLVCVCVRVCCVVRNTPLDYVILSENPKCVELLLDVPVVNSDMLLSQFPCT
jgi:hypothetical protein